MSMMEIYKMEIKDKELVKALSDNGYSIIEYMNWMSFQKEMGRI